MFEIRRVLTHVEDIFHEFGPPPAHPLRRGTLAAVMTNPFAGRYEPQIDHAMELLKPIGVALANRLLEAMAVPHAAIEGYGKGAIVGSAGELEHGALWHVPGGYAMRELLEKHGVPTNAIVPSTKKVGAPSAALDVPMTHVNASYVRSHFDAIEVRVPGAPAADEVVYILAMSTGQRVHARVGGLSKDAIAGKDGLR
ncbi:amino acid synthesis family protein [Paraburkholderia sp.]|uniref:amino acid synthesis family protein n=1 Tax=Paraburkholderia sp. TaxID=1926495 RepID=UPI003D6F4814